MATHDRLDELREELEARGADKIRLELVRRARNFKRSWVEMAEALVEVRAGELFHQWGYPDFHTYCQSELLLTKATVDKLTGSYSVVREHAPQVLARDGLAQPIPTVDAVEYFAKALRGTEPANDGETDDYEDDRVSELKQAVFDDQTPVAVLRRTFDPLFFPKPEGAERVEALEKTRSATRRLEALLQQVEGIDEARAKQLLQLLSQLREELDTIIPDAKAELGEAKRKAS
ncbi:MAG: hypothetical protein KF901_15105 [Myxococcales bacterium]|nr:hypothetical protein [Myxococcales bacterium]